MIDVRPPIMGHQRRAIDEVVTNPSLLVEYGTGTGKSRVIVEAIMVLIEAGEVPILVLVPNSLLEQTWEQFILWAGQDWTDRNVLVLDKSYSLAQRKEALRRGRSRVYVLSHEAMSHIPVRQGLAARQWAAVFLDEASRFRNYSKRTLSLQVVGNHATTRYAFSGNLTVRNPADSWYVMNWLDRGLFGMTKREEFIDEYCITGGFGGMTPIAIRPDKIAQFRGILDEHRIKAELRDIREMPERVLTVRRVTMPTKQVAAYEQMKETLRVEIERESEATFVGKANSYVARLMRLQEIAAGFSRNLEGDVVYLPSPKTEEMVETILADPEPPTVIWYWWQPELEVIRRALDKARLGHRILGRGDAVADFMSGKADILLAQLAKGGYGFNLQRATRMFYHSLPWDLDIYTQSQERNVRLDTTATSLEIVHLLARDSVDEYVRDRLVVKADMSRQLSRSQALEILR